MLWKAAVLAALGAGVWAVFYSPLLAVKGVKLVGARHTTSAEVVAAAGLTRDDNLLTLSTAAVGDAVEQLPWVKSAVVDRMLPGTVRVRVTERRGAMVLSIGAARWTIDAHGRVLQSGAVGELPILAGIQVGVVEPGIELRTPEAIDALEVWRSLPRALRRDVAAILAPTIERITFTMTDGRVVRYGAAENLHAKNEVLAALLRRIAVEQTPVAYIDVRVPSAPAVGGAAAPDPGAPAGSE
jgi:cell division protein FtsQ